MRHRHGGAEHDFGAVIGAARARQPWALEHLYSTLAPAIAGFFRLQRAAEPEDLTSEVFVGVLRNLPTFRGDEAHFRSWVFTIAYRRLADERRGVARHPHPRPLDEAPEPVDAADVEADVALLLATHRVRELCATLPPAQRDVLLLRLVGRMTVDEVAAVMERSRGAVKALQRRGLATVTAVVDERGVPL